MNNEFENNNGAGQTPPTEENTTYHYAYKPAGGETQNPQPGSGFDASQGNYAGQNTRANSGAYANGGYSNSQGAGSYSGAGSYYTPPQQPQQPGGEPPKKEKKPKKHREKKAKAVKLDEFGNPIPQKKNKTAVIICIVIAVCVALAVIGLSVSLTQLLKKIFVHGEEAGEDVQLFDLIKQSHGKCLLLSMFRPQQPLGLVQVQLEHPADPLPLHGHAV